MFIIVRYLLDQWRKTISEEKGFYRI